MLSPVLALLAEAEFPDCWKLAFSFANLHLNYSPTTGSEVAWAELPVERSVHSVSLHVVPGWGSSTSCPFTSNLGQVFCVKEAGNGVQCVFCFCCAPLCIHEKPRYDTWTQCAKVRQRDTNCSSVTLCSFSLLGKLEVVSAFISPWCHTGGCTKGCTHTLLVTELTSHFSSESFVWSHPELCFGARWWKPSLSLRKFNVLRKVMCCSWEALGGFEMDVCLYNNNNNNNNAALFSSSTGHIQRRQRWPQQQDHQASAEPLPCPSCLTHESWSAGR